MFRIVVCDENKESGDFLVNCISKFIREFSLDKSVELFKIKPESLINYKIKDNNTYLFFVDAIYNNTTGVDIARRLRGQKKTIFIVFYFTYRIALYDY